MPLPGRLSTLVRKLFTSRSQMAWRSHGSTNEELVDNLAKNGIITDQRVARVMKQVDRGEFCQSSKTSYDDAPQSIGFAVTISAPHMHAYALGAMADKLVEGARVLDVGSGSGYLTVCMAILVGATGKAVGIDHIPALVDLSKKNARKSYSKLLDSGQLEFVVGDGRLGYAAAGPYDAIHVGASAETLPKELIDQLKPNGRLICPVGGEYDNQHLRQIDKKPDGTISDRSLMGVRYVPLTDREKQWPGRLS